MAVITNLNTQQTPLTVAGLTGTQSVKFIQAPRVYIKTIDATPAPVTAKSNGVLPTGWADLGIVNGVVKVNYMKTVKEVRTGLDEVFRSEYIGKKTSSLDFTLSQFDDTIISQVSGLTASQIVNGSTYQYAVGSEDVVQKAVLLVLQNKLDGKEWQFYNPNAYMAFDITETSGELTLKCTANMPAFAWGGGTAQAYFVQSIFA